MSSNAAAQPQRKWWNGPVQGLQKVGRSLQLPVAVLPAAGLLVSLGNLFDSSLHGAFWDKFAKVLLNGGTAILDGEVGLPLLFCIGVAIGFAKKADGSTALAAVVGFLVYRGVLTAFPVDDSVTEATPDGIPQNPGVLGGIIIGLLTAVVWQRYHRTKLVDWLGFFNGRRTSVPILMAFLCVILGVLFGLLWQPVGDALTWFAKQLIDLGAWGAAIFGFANRLLIPIGMHQFLNTFFWFQAGEFTGDDGTVQGDISRFFAGDPSAGQFTSGFFPIMMFGLPHGGAGHRPLRPSGAAQGSVRADAVGGADVVRDRGDGAAGVLVPLRRSAAVRGARDPDRGVDGGHLGAGCARGLQFLGKPDRLRRQLAPGHETLADHPDRAVLRGRLLRDLPVRDHQVQPPDPGA